MVGAGGRGRRKAEARGSQLRLPPETGSCDRKKNKRHLWAHGSASRGSAGSADLHRAEPAHSWLLLGI